MATTIASDIIVCPFQILIDTREQAPYTFSNIPLRAADAGKRLVVPTLFHGLLSGDYSIDGMSDQVAIERKSIADLFGTLGGGRERFEREFERLNQLEFSAVVIEATWQEICRPQSTYGDAWRSKLNPRSVWGTIFSWSVRYPKVHWFTMGSRRLAELAVFELLERFWTEQQQNHGRKF